MLASGPGLTGLPATTAGFLTGLPFDSGEALALMDPPSRPDKYGDSLNGEPSGVAGVA